MDKKYCNYLYSLLIHNNINEGCNKKKWRNKEENKKKYEEYNKKLSDFIKNRKLKEEKDKEIDNEKDKEKEKEYSLVESTSDLLKSKTISKKIMSNASLCRTGLNRPD